LDEGYAFPRSWSTILKKRKMQKKRKRMIMKKRRERRTKTTIKREKRKRKATKIMIVKKKRRKKIAKMTKKEEEKEKEIDVEKDNYEEDGSESESQKIYEETVRELDAVNYTQVSRTDVDKRYRYQIQQLIDNYVPKQSNQTSVKTKIILQDETPICLKPRRLMVKKKTILNAQLEN